MTPNQLLSVGLIAAGMLATPAMARENYIAKRHATENAGASASATARYVDGQVCIPAPRVGALLQHPGAVTTSLASLRDSASQTSIQMSWIELINHLCYVERRCEGICTLLSRNGPREEQQVRGGLRHAA